MSIIIVFKQYSLITYPYIIYTIKARLYSMNTYHLSRHAPSSFKTIEPNVKAPITTTSTMSISLYSY